MTTHEIETIYLLLSWLIGQLVWLIFYRLRTRTVTTIERETGDNKIKWSIARFSTLYFCVKHDSPLQICNLQTSFIRLFFSDCKFLWMISHTIGNLTWSYPCTITFLVPIIEDLGISGCFS